MRAVEQVVELHRLGRDSSAEIRQLFDDCADFFALIHADHVGDATQIFDDVPLGTHAEQKLVFGAFAGRMIGLVELLRDYPAQHDWCLGLLLVSPAHRREGCGTAIVAEIIRIVSEAGGRAIHLVVQAQNPGALRFWQRHGWVVRNRTTQVAAHGSNQIDRLVLELPALTAAAR